MKTAKKCMRALLVLTLVIASVVCVSLVAEAANLFYGDYTDAAKIYDYGSCPSMQGLAVGSQKLYTVKINGSDSQAFISMTDKDSGATTKLYNADAGSYYFDYLGHANDMDVWGIDGYSNIFVTTTNTGANSIVRLKRSGNNLTKVAGYRLTYNGADTWVSALAVKEVSGGKITFICKLGMDIYTGSVSTGATSATIPLTKLCTLNKSRVVIKGQTLDLSSWVNQGFGYHDGTLFVPLSGDDDELNRSVILVYNIDGKSGTVYAEEALTFRVTSGAYSALFEIESCDICSADGKLYFNTNRRKTNSDTNHDGVSSFDGYTYSKITSDNTNTDVPETPTEAPTEAPTEPAVQTYTVRYNANGGSGTMADTIVPYGVSTNLRTNTFTRSGYKFVGWAAHRASDNKWYYENGSSSGWYKQGSQPSGYYLNVYTDGCSVAKTSSVNGDICTFYAQWEATAKTYTVRYNANGGSGTMADTVVTYGVSTKLRTNTFTRSGYKFVGWAAHRASDNKWYYENGSSSGWYKQGSQPSGYYLNVYSDGCSVAATSSVSGDICTFYAQWEATAKTYTVRYNANGGSGTMADTVVTYGVSTKLRTNTFTRSGYKFVGWAAHRASDNKWYYENGSSSGWYKQGSQPSGYYLNVYSDGCSVAATSSVSGDICTFYAQWESLPQSYTIRYVANGGSGTMADTIITYGVSTAIRSNAFTRNGWSFAGWTAHRTSDNKWYYTNGSSSGWYMEGAQPSGWYLDVYSNGCKVAKTSSVAGDLVYFHAQWEPKDITYTVRYNANGGSGTMEDTTVVYGYNTNLSLNTFTKSGYTFSGWTAYRSAKNQWYYTNGSDSGWYKEGSQPSGWYKSVYSDGVSVARTTSVSNDLCIFYAQWTKN